MAVDRTYFVDVFGEIVDSMRITGVITDSVEVSGVYTLTTPNTFEERDILSINDIDYLIIGATSATITIEGASGLDFTDETWKYCEPHYMYGHAKEISNRLDLKTRDAIDKFGKFPLIWLVTDLKESSGNNYNYLYTISTPRIFLVNKTDPNYTSPERTENNFKPILQPLYEDLVTAILDSRLIDTSTNQLEKEKYDRYAWGSASAYGSDKLIFNQYMDAIEFIPKELSVFKKSTNC